MRRIPSAAERARWLAEVAQTLDQAQMLVERMGDGLGDGLGDSGERAELIQRIEGARRMTRALRLSSDRRLTQAFPPH